MAEEGSRLLYVPEAIEQLILVRLPVKSIVRFKSVCKRWHSLFRSKQFMEFYFGFLDKEAFVPRSKDLGLIHPELRRSGRRSRTSVTSVLGPLSNGIYALTSFLLTKSKWHIAHALPHTLKIALYNPATTRVKFAAPFPNEYRDLLSGVSSISCSVHCGIDDDYRVVVLINYEGGSDVRNGRMCILVFLYTWRTKEWEKVVHYDPYQKRIGLPQATQVFKGDIVLQVFDNMMACSQKLFNGCWHWLIEQYDEGEVKTFCSRFGVLSFDFESKSFRLISGPPFKIILQADVFVLQDQLAAIVVYQNKFHDLWLEIWRKTTTTTWTSLYNVNINQPFVGTSAILHDLDYYQAEEEEEEEEEEEQEELIRIRRLVLVVHDERRHTFDDDKGHMVEDFIDSSNPKISLSVGGISKFTPTFEPLPL